MKGRWGRWRLAARLARREVRRHPWRHALVVVMIFVPVLAAFATFSGLASVSRIEARQDRFQYAGRSGGFVGTPPEAAPGNSSPQNSPATATTIGPSPSVPVAPGDPPSKVDAAGLVPAARSRLPAGTDVETQWEGGDWLVTDRPRSDGRGPLLAGSRMIEAPDGSRLAARFIVEQGRLPRTAEEILISPPLADAGGWHVGSLVTSARSMRRFKVVGIGPTGDHIDDRAAAVAKLPVSYWTQSIDSDNLPYPEVGASRSADLAAERSTNIWLPPNADPETLRIVNVTPDQDRTHLDARVGPGVTLGATAISALVAVVASAAFAIASRRQLRTVGLLSTAGADPATIRAALVLQGAIPGVLAGASAVITGLAVIAGANHFDVPERVWDVAGAHLVASAGGAILAVTLGLAAGMLAAWQPANTAARVPVLTALAGRRPVGPVPTRLPVGGVVALVAGAGLLLAAFKVNTNAYDSLAATLQPFLVIGGVAVTAVGGVLLAPLLVALMGPLAGRCTGTTRLALRGLARHRAQSAATVAAVGFALALPVGLLTSNTIQRQDRLERVELVTSSSPPTSATYSLDGRPLSAEVEIRDIRRTDKLTAIVVSGDGQNPDVLAVRQKVIDLLGPSASVVRVIPLVDSGGDWRNVAVIDDAAASRALAPSASNAIRSGKAIALGGSPAIQYFVAGGQRATFTMSTGSLTRFIDGLGADYLVGQKALGSVGADRPVGSIAVARTEPLNSNELRALVGLGWQRPDLRYDGPPTLARVQAALSGPRAEPTANFSIDVSRPSDFDRRSTPGSARPPRSRLSSEAKLLVGLAVGSGFLALLVLTVTLALRSVDTEAERRAAIAAGASPARMRNQTAVEGAILAGLGAILALPLGWFPVTAAWTGSQRRNAGFRNDASPPLPFHWPGWEVLPILAVPVLVAGLAWLIFPALAAALRRGPEDQVIERW